MNLWGAVRKIISGGVNNDYRAIRTDDDGHLEVVVSGLTLAGFSYGAAPVRKTPVAASVTSVTLLAANANRKKGSYFYNKSESATLYIALDATATFDNARVVPPGGHYIMDASEPDYLGVVSGIWDAAVGQCNVEEAL